MHFTYDPLSVEKYYLINTLPKFDLSLKVSYNIYCNHVTRAGHVGHCLCSNSVFRTIVSPSIQALTMGGLYRSLL